MVKYLCKGEFMRYTKSLKGSVNFKRVLKQGKYVSGKNIAIYVKRNDLNNGTNRLGICVSKKHGNSVVRNKLKRWVREAYYSLENSLDKNYNIVILYRKGIEVEKLSYNVLKSEITCLFTEIELVHE